MSSILLISGVVIPALVVTAVTRHWYHRVSWATAAFLVLLSVAFVSGGMFTKSSPFPLDEVVRGYPYRARFGEVPSGNPLTNDVVKQILPWMQVAREQLLQGHAPLWNRYQFSGYPLLGNGQSAPFAPLFLATLFISLPKQLVVMAALKIFLALFFGYAFLRRLNVSHWSAIGASAVYAFSVFETVYLFYPLTSVTSLLPAMAFAIHGAVFDGRRRWLVLIATTTACVIAGGHPESAFHVAIACGALLLIFGLTGGFSKRRALQVFMAALAGAALAAPAWLPVAQQALLSGRAENISGGTGVNAPFNTMAAFAVLNPDAFGNPARGDWSWIYNYSMVAPSYFGLVATALFCAFCLGLLRRNPFGTAIVLAAIVLFLVAMDWTVLGHLVNSVPPFKFVANDRLRFVVSFFVAIIAALQSDHLAGGGRATTIAAGSVLLLCATWLLYKKWGGPLGMHSAAGVIALCGLILLVVFVPSSYRRRVIPPAVAILILGELIAFNYGFNRLAPDAYYRPRLAMMDRLHELVQSRPGRIVGFDWTFLPNGAAQYGMEDVRGSDPMVSAAYRKFLSVFCVPESLHDVPRVQDVDHSALDFLNVRYLLTEPGFAASSKWQLEYDGPDGRIYESRTSLPRFFAPAVMIDGARSDSPPLQSLDLRSTVLVQGHEADNQNPPATIVDHTNGSGTEVTLNIEATAPAFIASSQVFAPGWRLDINRQRSRIFTVNGAFIGFDVPAGASVAHLKYAPLTYRAGWLLFAIALTAGSMWIKFGSHTVAGAE